MGTTGRRILLFLATASVLFAFHGAALAGNRDGLGVRAGMSQGPDQFLLGAQAEFGPIIESTYLVPSLDLGFDDTSVVTANLDLRWYLLRLPETGLHFYGSAGPTLLLSPGTDVGLSLTAGLHIPMRNQRRYNVEMRFGFGDIPDFKFAAALVWGM